MKILLMNVPDDHVAKTTSDWDLKASDIGVFPPVGLMYLAASLRERTKHQVKIVDNILARRPLEDIVSDAAAWRPDLIGMTVYTPLFHDTLLLSEALKKALPGTKLVWGGPHTSLFPEESFLHPVVDYLVVGEAEESFPRFCDALQEGRSFDGIPGICYRKNSALVSTGGAGYIENIDSLPFPEFRLLDFRRYFSAIGTGKPVGTICSSRGCPFQCTFCCKPYKTYRSRSPENVLREMEIYHEEGIREFFFFDDLFNVSPERVEEIARGILEKKWRIAWSFRGRIDGVNEGMLSLAKKAGCRQIFYGIETGTDEGLRAIKKKITVKQVKDVMQMTRKAGIITSTNWIIGFPHEKDRADIMRTVHAAITTGSDYAQFNICIAYQGTEIFEEGVRNNVFSPDVWRNYVKNPNIDFCEPIWDRYLSREELSALLKDCYRRFYFRPRAIMAKLLAIKNIKELILHIRSALTILGLGGYRRKK